MIDENLIRMIEKTNPKKAKVIMYLMRANQALAEIKEGPLAAIEAEIEQGMSPLSYTTEAKSEGNVTYLKKKPVGDAPLINFDYAYIEEKIDQILTMLKAIKHNVEMAKSVGKE